MSPSAPRRLRFSQLAAVAMTLAASVVACEKSARAELPSSHAAPVYVLDIDSDDAEDQAEALSSALRSRVRTATGYSLLETNQALSTLMVALKCPPKPDAPCLQRIGDQLRADRFVWGTLSKGPTPHMVTGDVHLWARGKPDASLKESYTDNLKDPSDESLKKIASRFFEKITGTPANGTVVIQSSVERGTVVVDGVTRAQLERGQARLEIPAGSHVIEVRSPGFATSTQTLNVAASVDTPVTFALAPGSTEDLSAPREAQKPFPARRVVGWSTVGVGVVAIGIGAIEGFRFLGLKSDLDDYRQTIPKNLTDICSEEAQSNATAVLACRKANDARDARTLGFVLGGAGVAVAAVGVVLLLTDSSSGDASKDRGVAVGPKLNVLPSFGPTGGSLDLHGTF